MAVTSVASACRARDQIGRRPTWTTRTRGSDAGPDGLLHYRSMASGSWTDDEIGTTVDAYFRRLTLELAGETYTRRSFAASWRGMLAAPLPRLSTSPRTSRLSSMRWQPSGSPGTSRCASSRTGYGQLAG